MKVKIVFALFLPIMLFLFFTADAGTAASALTDFKIIILIVPSESYKHKYSRIKEVYYEVEERFNVYDIQEALARETKNRLNSHQNNGKWEAVVCKTSKEFEKKAGENDVYLGLRMEIVEYRSKYKDSDLDDREDAELTVNCDLRKKTGMAWTKVISKRVTSKATDTNDKEVYQTSIEAMSEQIDTAIINNLISYQVLGSMSKDARTKIVKVRLINTSPLSIKRVTWALPQENGNQEIITDISIKPRESSDLTIKVSSEKSHAAIQWRSLYVTGIEFDVSGK